jgi:hypothetical protein
MICLVVKQALNKGGHRPLLGTGNHVLLPFYPLAWSGGHSDLPEWIWGNMMSYGVFPLFERYNLVEKYGSSAALDYELLLFPHIVEVDGIEI